MNVLCSRNWVSRILFALQTAQKKNERYNLQFLFLSHHQWQASQPEHQRKESKRRLVIRFIIIILVVLCWLVGLGYLQILTNDRVQEKTIFFLLSFGSHTMLMRVHVILNLLCCFKQYLVKGFFCCLLQYKNFRRRYWTKQKRKKKEKNIRDN